MKDKSNEALSQWRSEKLRSKVVKKYGVESNDVMVAVLKSFPNLFIEEKFYSKVTDFLSDQILCQIRNIGNNFSAA